MLHVQSETISNNRTLSILQKLLFQHQNLSKRIADMQGSVASSIGQHGRICGFQRAQCESDSFLFVISKHPAFGTLKANVGLLYTPPLRTCVWKFDTF
jgi:hypothetical protein